MAKPLCSEREFVLGGATVLLARGPANARTGLVARAAGGVLELPPDRISVQHSCPRCGGRDHGRPVVAAIGPDDRTCWVSSSRTGNYAAAAAHGSAPIGVDIESVSRIWAHPVDDVLLHPIERRAIARLRPEAARRRLAQLWVAKEAILKSTGDGLTRDLTQLLVTVHGRKATVQSWPDTLALAAPPQVGLFDVGSDVVGALATQR